MQLERRYGMLRAQLQAGRDRPPHDPLTAIDRGKPVPLTLRTFDPGDARRLAERTEKLLASR